MGERGNVLEGNVVLYEEGRELSGRLIVEFEFSDRKAERVNERQHRFEGGDIGRRRSRLYGVVVNETTVERDKNVLMTKIRRDRKATSEIGGGPFRVMGSVGVAVVGGVGRNKAGRAAQGGR